MSKKIASIVIYEIYGSKGHAVDLVYRGKVLHGFMGEKIEIGAMIQKAHEWAMNQGFINTKTVYKG